MHVLTIFSSLLVRKGMSGNGILKFLIIFTDYSYNSNNNKNNFECRENFQKWCSWYFFFCNNIYEIIKPERVCVSHTNNSHFSEIYGRIIFAPYTFTHILLLLLLLYNYNTHIFDIRRFLG